MEESRRILVVGAGAVGGITAAILAREQYDIWLVAKYRDLAEKWVDFMLSPTFQADIPLQMYVFPVNPNATLDATFVEFLAVPDHPVLLDPAEIAEKREQWLDDWTELVLR